MKRTYFGTDGVRGLYGGPVINEEFAARLGAAAGRWAGGQGRVVIGCDTRASGPALVAALAGGLQSAGMAPAFLGVIPTPAVAREVARSGAALGAVVTASHNPSSDNGIKFFGPAGMKLTDDEEAAIEAVLPPTATIVRELPPPESAARESYITASTALLPKAALQGWRIVLDTAHGATCGTSPAVLRQLGAEVIGIGDQPNGTNINEGVGSEHPEALCARVRASGARLGLAHDGDGDRCIVCDETGAIVDGDELLTVLALQALRHGRLGANELVITVQSNLGVDAAVAAAGGTVYRTDVGDRYVIERMRASGATLGGESSGHVICADVLPTGDGLVAGLRLIEVLLSTGMPLSQLRRALRKFPQRTAALKVREKRPLASLVGLQAEIAALERELGAQGRILVRYSGTEPKIRLLIEGPSDTIVDAGLARLRTAVGRELELV